MSNLKKSLRRPNNVELLELRDKKINSCLDYNNCQK